VEFSRIFVCRFPFVACEIFTCEVDVIMKTLVENEDLMDLLFSYLKPDRPHGTLLAGYFCKVVICLMLRKTLPFVNYVQVCVVLLSVVSSSFALLFAHCSPKLALPSSVFLMHLYLL
jgi:hypothetical protein